MSSQPEGLRTPHRTTTSNMFDEATTPSSNPFTPCTRLSRMTIESQSNGLNGRTRKTAPFQYPVSNFNDKLMQVVREEEEQQQQQQGGGGTHPNLDMFLGTDRISMNKDHFFSEDEESDEGDLFSSSLCPMSSPERILTRQSIFDDEPMNSPPQPTVLSLNKKSIFDDDDDDDEDEENEDQHHNMQQDNDEDYYDPSTLWLSQIYHDTSSDSPSSNTTTTSSSSSSQENSSSSDDNENRAPRHWHRNREEKKTRRTLPQEEDNTANERLPLREIKFEDYLSDNEDTHAKKKSLLSNGKHHKMRFMRTLSPPRFAAKRKEQVILS